MEDIQKMIEMKITEISPKQLTGLISKIRYNTEPEYKAKRNAQNHEWYVQKNNRTNNDYKAELCRRVKDKYANNEEYREKIKKQKRERYARMKEERSRQNTAVSSA